jgi:biopolymer transport protein ExbD
MMDMGGARRQAKSEINVTPLIDIVLVLLIVFIAMLPGLTKVLPVAVPRVVTSFPPPKADPANPPVVISVLPSASGAGCDYLLQSAPIQLREILGKLTPALVRQVPGLRKVILRIDGEVPYQKVVDVLDQVRRASDQAKRETLARLPVDGGDAKVVVAVRKAGGKG